MPIQSLENQTLLACGYAIAIYGVALLHARLLLCLPSVSQRVTPSTGRYGTIDGIRGVLALGVFVHHSFAAYGYFTGRGWHWSESALLNHLGQTTVALFFAITGFLFANKAMSPKFDWPRFYADRLARLWPAYLLMVCIVFTLVFALSGFVLQEAAGKIVRELLQWLALGYFGAPDVNDVKDSWTLMAGVNWSLKYELLFYAFGVPSLYLAARVFRLRTLLLGTAGMLLALLFQQQFSAHRGGNAMYAAHFLIGICAAYLNREPQVAAVLRDKRFHAVASINVLLLLTMVNAYGPAPILVTLVFFCAITGGLSIFGLLKTKPALWLGDISYGIYLLHGLCLWVTLFVLRHFGWLGSLSLPGYLAIIALLGTVVVTAASISYICLELPVMESCKRRFSRRPMQLGEQKI